MPATHLSQATIVAQASLPPLFDTEGAAQAHCPKDVVVWLNIPSGIYHYKGERWYGRAEHGGPACGRSRRAIALVKMGNRKPHRLHQQAMNFHQSLRPTLPLVIFTVAPVATALYQCCRRFPSRNSRKWSALRNHRAARYRCRCSTRTCCADGGCARNRRHRSSFGDARAPQQVSPAAH